MKKLNFRILALLIVAFSTLFSNSVHAQGDRINIASFEWSPNYYNITAFDYYKKFRGNLAVGFSTFEANLFIDKEGSVTDNNFSYYSNLSVFSPGIRYYFLNLYRDDRFYKGMGSGKYFSKSYLRAFVYAKYIFCQFLWMEGVDNEFTGSETGIPKAGFFDIGLKVEANTWLDFSVKVAKLNQYVDRDYHQAEFNMLDNLYLGVGVGIGIDRINRGKKDYYKITKNPDLQKTNKYLGNFPKADNASDVRVLMEDYARKEWNSMEKTKDRLSAFILRYPYSKLVEEAEDKICEIDLKPEWDKIKNTEDIDELNSFLEINTCRKYADLANARIKNIREKSDWLRIADSNHRADVHQFLVSHPNGLLYNTALEKYKILMQKYKADSAAFYNAVEPISVRSLESFVKSSQGSELKEEAQMIIEDEKLLMSFRDSIPLYRIICEAEDIKCAFFDPGVNDDKGRTYVEVSRGFYTLNPIIGGLRSNLELTSLEVNMKPPSGNESVFIIYGNYSICGFSGDKNDPLRIVYLDGVGFVYLSGTGQKTDTATGEVVWSSSEVD